MRIQMKCNLTRFKNAHSCIYGIVVKQSDMFAAHGTNKAAKVSAAVSSGGYSPCSSQAKDILAHARLCGNMENTRQCHQSK
jgi:hypothetical protein